MWNLSEKNKLIETSGRFDDKIWVEKFVRIVDLFLNHPDKDLILKNNRVWSEWFAPFLLYLDKKVKDTENLTGIKMDISTKKYMFLPFNAILMNLGSEYNPDWNDVEDIKAKAIQCALRLCGMTHVCSIFEDMLDCLVNRILNDQNEISSVFFNGKVSKCLSIKLLDADYHGSQTGIFLVEYDLGKVVYKPRDLSICRLWNFFVETCAQGHLKPIQVLFKDGYGYMEYIENTSADESRGDEYFFNWGAFLATCTFFHSSDLHDNNIFIHNNSPLLIDMETLITPSSKWEKKNQLDVFEYLIKQGLLSSYHSVNQRGFIHNKYGYLMKEARRFVDKGLMTQDEIIENVQAGFLKVMHQTMCCRNCLVQEFQKDEYHSIPVRFLVRDTKIYYRLLESSYRKCGGSNFEVFESELDRLHLAFKKFKDKKLLELGDWEIEDIRDGNIPIFYIMFHDKYIYHDGKQNFGELLSESPLDCIMSSIVNIDDDTTYASQLAIRIIMKALFDDSKCNVFIREAKWADVDHLKMTTMDMENILKEIKKTIIDALVFVPKGKSHWIQNEHSGIWIADHSLFDGKLGIAMFLSLYAHYFNDQEAKNVAFRLYLECISAYENATNSMGEGPVMPWSLMHGISGLIYVSAIFWKLGYKKESEHAINLSLSYINHSSIPNKVELYDGVAGTIIALSRVHHIVDTTELIDKLCRFISNQVTLNKEWISDSTWAHGKVGVAYALVKAAEILQNENYSRMAVNLLEECNIPDDSKILGLCRGKIGLCYAVSFIPDYLMTATLEKIELYGRKLCLTQRIENVGNLCCGDAGLRELAIRYYEKTKDSQFLFAAMHFESIETGDKMGMLSGMSGKGYVLMHLLFQNEIGLFWN